MTPSLPPRIRCKPFVPLLLWEPTVTTIIRRAWSLGIAISTLEKEHRTLLGLCTQCVDIVCHDVLGLLDNFVNILRQELILIKQFFLCRSGFNAILSPIEIKWTGLGKGQRWPLVGLHLRAERPLWLQRTQSVLARLLPIQILLT